MLWSERAKAEVRNAARTWFGTLTFRPEVHVRFINLARQRLAVQGVDFDSLPFGEQFSELHRQAGGEITKYVKRLRKECVDPFRMICVAEHHKSGLPHYHLLIHELTEGSVKHSALSSQWQLGFEKWRLITDLNQAGYVCKYLSKASVARVRASAGYGEALAIAERDILDFQSMTPQAPSLPHPAKQDEASPSGEPGGSEGGSDSAPPGGRGAF